MPRLPKTFVVPAIACAAGLLSAKDAHAQQRPAAPRDVIALPAASPSAREVATRGEPATGNLTTEIAVGAGAGTVALVVGLGVGAASTFDCHDPDENSCPSLAMLYGGVATLLVAPLVLTIGVAAAGRATGGNGSVLWTAVGAVAGTVVGFYTSLAMVDGLSQSGLPLPISIGASVLVMLIPAVGGTVLGYRLSADVPVQATVAPTLDGRGAIFSIRGVM